MKRFYCTVCKRIRRVRQLPPGVEKNINNAYTTGECRWHGEALAGKATRAQVNHRGRIVAGLGSTRKMSASSAKSKSKNK